MGSIFSNRTQCSDTFEVDAMKKLIQSKDWKSLISYKSDITFRHALKQIDDDELRKEAEYIWFNSHPSNIELEDKSSVMENYDKTLMLQSETNSSGCVTTSKDNTLHKDICRDEKITNCFSNPMVRARLLQRAHLYIQGSANVYGFIYKYAPPSKRDSWLQAVEICWDTGFIAETGFVGEANKICMEWVMNTYPESPQLLKVVSIVITEFCLLNVNCSKPRKEELAFKFLDYIAKDISRLHIRYPKAAKKMVAILCSELQNTTNDSTTVDDIKMQLMKNEVSLSNKF